MKIFVAHATELPWKQEMYTAIRDSALNTQHDFYLPQEGILAQKPPIEKDFIKKFDLVIAECSRPSIGMGIELGWSDLFKIPILCIYKKDMFVTGSIKIVTDYILTYENGEDMLKKIGEFLSSFTPASR